MATEADIVKKAFHILKKELSAEEYIGFFRAITPKFKNSTKELRDLTKELTIDDISQELQKRKLDL